MTPSDITGIIRVKARSREAVTFEGEAVAVTSINDRGEFDVLPNHANFISIIKDYIIIKKKDGQEQKIELKGPTVLKVWKNRVDIYLGLGNQLKPK